MAVAAALVASSLALFAARCVGDPRIPFLFDDAAAPWVMLPLSPAGTTGMMGLAPRDAPPVTTFTRHFEAPADAGPFELRVRALRDFELWLNGERLAASRPGAHWRRFASVDASRALRPGDNELRVLVRNPTGPALLSLGGRGVDTASGWQAAQEAAAAQPVARAGSGGVNPSTYAMPAPGAGLLARRDALIGLFLAGAGALLLARRPGAARRLPRLAGALPAALVLVWLALFWPNVLRIPLSVGFDARHHVAYVDFLRAQRALPLPSDGWSMFHPPLYYVATALLVGLQQVLAAGSTSLASWKLVGFASGLASAGASWALARQAFGPRSREAAYAGLFAAALPMNLTLSAYVTNESLHAATASAVLWATARLLRRERPGSAELLAWGGLAALAVLVKYTAWIAVAVGAACLALRWLRAERAAAGAVAARLAPAAAVVLALSGWWYARNALRVGQLFPLNVDLPGQTQVWWSQPGYFTPAFFLHFGAVLRHPFLAGTHAAWDSFYSTLWGDGQLAGQKLAAARHPYWDWELMAALYWLALPATALLLFGAARSARVALAGADAGLRALHSFLLAFSWTLLLGVLYMTLRQPDYGQTKAFYALSGVGPLAVFFALGCGGVDRWLEARGATWARALLHGWLAAFAGAVWLTYAG